MNIVNIMNFVRGVEPRNPMLDLVEPVRHQIELNKKYGFANTFLLQYDAILRDDFVQLFKANQDDNTELGVWIEIVRPLVEKVGIEWRGRPGYDWDWYVNPGFLPAYTKQQKTVLIDEIMHKFRQTFGTYPKSVGSWLLDAYSMQYMSMKYNISSFAICREQLAVDAYTLWGGPYNQPYYASVNNMLCPAQTSENAIKAPVFRLLGIEPIRGYGKKYFDTPECDGCPTMEPVWKFGQNEKCMRWFFDTYFCNENMGIAYTQIGQENSFGWKSMGKALEMQYALVDEYRKCGKVEVIKMCDAGERFKRTYEQTPAAAICATDDWTSRNKYRSVWFSNKNYRANLLFDDGKMFFRDIQKFDENYHDRYEDKPCLAWDAVYDNLPVVDERMWSDEDKNITAGLVFCGSYTIKSVQNQNGALVVTAIGTDGNDAEITFLDDRIRIKCRLSLVFNTGINRNVELKGNTLNLVHNDYSYSVVINAETEKSGDDIIISGEVKEIIF